MVINTLEKSIEELTKFANGVKPEITLEYINQHVAIGSKVTLNEEAISKLASDGDKRDINNHLIFGEEYEVTTKVISGEHTDAYLEGYPGVAFNLDLFVSA